MSSRKTHQILDDLPDRTTLPVVPSQLWLILNLEVVISDGRETYLALVFPSYGWLPQPVNALDEGYWCPPFFGHPVSMSYESPDTVRSIKKLFEEFENQINPQDDIGHLAYLMGLPDPTFARIGSFIELKNSPRSPEVVKCFKIIRFALEYLGLRGRRNLADPECRKGYVFLPIGRLKEVLTKRYSRAHGRLESLYLSKPLMSNVDYILSPNRIDQLVSRAILLNPSDFVRSEEGLVIAADLAGYGATAKYATEHMHSFDKRGADIASEFREAVAALLSEFLTRAGVFHAQIAGDGFLCTIPRRVFPKRDVSRALKSFFRVYRRFLAKVDILNSYIRDPLKTLGSRIAVHYGSYKFGRIARGYGASPGFEGASIIEAARLEAALREFVKGPVITGIEPGSGEKEGRKVRDQRATDRPHPRPQLRHSMICSASALDAARAFFESEAGISYVADLRLGVKEFEVVGKVFRIEESEA